MRKSLSDLLANVITLKYTLPTASIPQITISTQSDYCYNVLTNDCDIAKVIYNGIVEYSFEESQINIMDLDNFQKRALMNKLHFNYKDSEDCQLNYGFYGEVLLFLLLQKYHGASTLISRGHFYNPLENSETKGYDTYQMILQPNAKVELWFGEVKFHKSFYTGIRQILDKISLSLSDGYFGNNILAMEDYESFINTEVCISPILQAFRDNPDINLAQMAHKHGMSFVYPMLVIFDDKKKKYDDIIKSVVSYTNKRYNTLSIHFSINYSLFFMFLPVNEVQTIKKTVLSWIKSKNPLI